MPEITAKKNLGQHFLVDENFIEEMLNFINPKPNEEILEIGAGLGALSIPVLKRSKKLTAIELDKRSIEILSEKAKNIGELRLIYGDFLKLDLNNLDLKPPIRLIGNLPYNISTPILFHCLKYRHLIKDMIFMLQKEVVQRICATANDKNYGRLSIMLSQFFEAEFLFTLPPSAFSPPPKVDSAVLIMKTRKNPAWQVKNQEFFSEIVKIAFSQRRKMIRKSLEKFISSQNLEKLAINPQLRPENLSGEDFAKIANFIAQNSSF